jgi:hypothetical protein
MLSFISLIFSYFLFLFFIIYSQSSHSVASDLIKVTINSDGTSATPLYVSYNNPSLRVVQPNAMRFLYAQGRSSSSQHIIVMNASGMWGESERKMEE